MNFLRATLFTLIFGVYTIVGSLLLLVFVKPLPLRQRFMVIRRFNAFTISCGKWICGVDYEIKGLENLPKDRPYVLLANHQSEWETFFMYVLLGPVCTVLKKELLSIPFFGWGLSLTGPIAIDRSIRTGALKQLLKQGKARLEEGIPVLVFPQGTRLPPGEVGRFNKGGIVLAASAKVPVVPLVHDAGVYWPAKKFVRKPGVIKIEIGKPMETTDHSVEEVGEYAQSWIEERIVAQKAEHKGN